MSATSVTALDHTIEETNVWLKAIDEQLHLQSRQDAYNALRAVLHALRDRLPAAVAVHLAAQLPTLIRGIYFESWQMSAEPARDRKVADFIAHVQTELPPRFPVDALTAARAVFEILWERLDPETFAKVAGHLPEAIRTLRP
ncbi:MAG: DUF2267 domain-containing protein [Xanthobacteraceae bacterium]|nr:DUF2267 domain-containing protein [Xanthobacteraceae bacterium]